VLGEISCPKLVVQAPSLALEFENKIYESY
jgi:hypothetical protein